MQFQKIKECVSNYSLAVLGVSLMLILTPTVFMLTNNWWASLIFAFALMWCIFMIGLFFQIDDIVRFYCIILIICITTLVASAITSNIYKDKIEIEKSKVREEINSNIYNYIDTLLINKIEQIRQEGYDKAFNEVENVITKACTTLESDLSAATTRAYQDGYKQGWEDKSNNDAYSEEYVDTWDYWDYVSVFNWELDIKKELEYKNNYHIQVEYVENQKPRLDKKELKNLYNSLINKGYTAYDIGDYNTFSEKMQSCENRKQLYEYVSSTHNIGSYEDYENRLTITIEDYSKYLIK